MRDEPLPPEVLADALQDTAHHEIGIVRPAKAVRLRSEESPGQRCVRELWEACERFAMHSQDRADLAARIDTLVKRERAAVWDAIAERLADWDLATIDADWTLEACECAGHLLIQISNVLSREAARLRARAAEEE